MALKAAPPQAFSVFEAIELLVQLRLVAELGQHFGIVLAPFGFQLLLQELRQGDGLLILAILEFCVGLCFQGVRRNRSRSC